MGLALVKDLREYRSAPTEEDIEAFETDTLAGLVLARSSAGLADATIRGEIGHLEQVRAWFGRPLWEMEPSDADAYFGRVLRGTAKGTRLARSAAISTYFLFLDLRHKVEIYNLTGRVVELLAAAQRCTAVIDDDATDYVYGGNYAFFGPSKIAMIGVEIAISQGDASRALRLARGITPSRRVPPIGRSRHLLDVAQAQTWEGQYSQAVATLTRVKASTPEWMRYQVLARVVVRQILDGKGRRRIEGLRPLAVHVNALTG